MSNPEESLDRIATALEKANEIWSALLKVMASPQRRVTPANTLLSGSWPRRDGTGYAPLEPPGEPPHGSTDDQTGHLRSPDGG
jgi:hypothetical protein